MNDTTTKAAADKAAEEQKAADEKAAADKAAEEQKAAEAKADADAQRGRLRDLSTMIDAEIRGDRAALVKVLTEKHGLKIAKIKGSDLVAAKMAGVTGAQARDEYVAVQNWANAARRQLNQMGG